MPPPGDAPLAPPRPDGKPWLQIWFRCCNVYGRIYKNTTATAYLGSCPKCGSKLRVPVGKGGTSRRSFEAG